MRKEVLLILLVIFLNGCLRQDTVQGDCPRPYLEYERGKCCIDTNRNLICDDEEIEDSPRPEINEPETVEEENVEEKKTETNEKTPEDVEPEPEEVIPKTGGLTIKKGFKFEYETYSKETKEIGIVLTTEENKYNYYKNLPRENTSITDYIDMHDPMVEEIVLELLAKMEALEEYNVARMAAAFMRSMSFEESRNTGYDNHPKFPIETLVDQTGDSQDASILAASILRGMGAKVVLIDIPEDGNLPRHMGIAIYCKGCDGKSFRHEGKNYYYFEATNPVDMGVISAKHDRDANVIPIA